jgi:hypothetical protein
MLPSTFVTVSASAALCFSKLNLRPHTVAVYASPTPSPTQAQHSLTGGRYPLPARDFHPLELASFGWRTTNGTNPTNTRDFARALHSEAAFSPSFVMFVPFVVKSGRSPDCPVRMPLRLGNSA